MKTGYQTVRPKMDGVKYLHDPIAKDTKSIEDLKFMGYPL